MPRKPVILKRLRRHACFAAQTEDDLDHGFDLSGISNPITS
jgi:hypothetical protein